MIYSEWLIYYYMSLSKEKIETWKIEDGRTEIISTCSNIFYLFLTIVFSTVKQLTDELVIWSLT